MSATCAWPTVRPVSVEACLKAALSGADGRVFLAVSGGRDSMVLLHAAASVLPPQKLCVLHVDHGLHLDSGGWSRHVASASAALQIECRSHRVRLRPGSNLEARARGARYGWFDTVLAVGDVLLTAHHQQDQAETVLLREQQGRGSYGMPACRPLGAGELRRPFLQLPSVEIERWARQHGLRWVEDPSNQDTRHDRNALRHQLLPTLSPDEVAAVARRGDEGQRAAMRERQRLRLAPSLPVATAAERAQAWLAALGINARRRTLARWLAAPSAPCDVGQGWLRAELGRIHFVPRLPARQALSGRGDLPFPHGRVVVSNDCRGAELRFGHAGLKLPEHAGGGPLKAWLHRCGLPPWQRPLLPVLCQQDVVLAAAQVSFASATAMRWEPRLDSGDFACLKPPFG